MCCRIGRIAAAFAALAVTVSARDALALPGVDLGAGIIGGVGVEGLGKPSSSIYQTSSGALYDTSYPGFVGVSGGAGIMLDARVIKFLGLEVDFLRMADKGSGDIKAGGQNVSVTIGQPALHIPVLAKLALPSGLLRPFAVVGPEFVFPGKSDLSMSPSGVITGAGTSYAENYTMFAFGFGCELVIPAVDIRVPLTLRGAINPSTSSSIQDRVRIDAGPSVSFRSEWQYQAVATLGVAYYF